ncbi:MAG: 3-dehydroquinate synthase family protein [Candidatus Peribacteraceae bacterium]
MHTYHVSVPAQTKHRYPVIVGSSSDVAWDTEISALQDADRIAVLYDSGIRSIADSIAARWSNTTLFAIPSGESSKSMQRAEQLVQDMLVAGMTRRSAIINVGGGMVTDLGGFVASIFMRGICFVNVPTTLLAMVDAAIGGKVYVNAGQVKNMIGHVWHPQAVLVDTDTLRHLPDALLADGLVEVVKMASVGDAEFFGWLEEHMADILARGDSLITAIEQAARLKAEAVSSAEDDSQRLLLNFGHTIGHALESLSGFRLSHGQAVSIGMSCELALHPCPDGARIRCLLETLGMPIDFPAETNSHAVWDLMRHDKKAEGGAVHIAVPLCVGSGSVVPLDRGVFLQAFS